MKLDDRILKSMSNGRFGLFCGRRIRPAFFGITEAYSGRGRWTTAWNGQPDVVPHIAQHRIAA